MKTNLWWWMHDVCAVIWTCPVDNELNGTSDNNAVRYIYDIYNKLMARNTKSYKNEYAFD